jgi:HEAT repeat protein
VSAWAQRALADEPAVRDEAVEALLQFYFADLGEGAVPPLERALKSESRILRERAAEALYIVARGPRCEAELAGLIKRLGDKDPWERLSAAHSLSLYEKAALPARPALERALSDPNRGVRKQAALALAGLGPDGKAAIPTLLAMLNDKKALLDRMCAAISLGHIGPAAAEAVPPLVGLLEEPSEGLREVAALALARIGPAAKPALPALRKALKDDDPDVRINAALALWHLERDTRTTVPILRQAFRLENPHTDLRLVLQALGEMGSAAREAVPDLIPLLRQEKYCLHWFAAQALRKEGPG